MSQVARPPVDGVFTWDDIVGEPDDGLRREIIEGTLIVNPAPVYRHQLVSLRLTLLFEQSTPDHLRVVVAPFDWRYDGTNVVEPDLLVCRTDDLDLDGPLMAPARPVLLVEILSPSNARFDRLDKRELYERLGVAHYWLVDPGASTGEPAVTVLELGQDGRYDVTAQATGAEAITLRRPFPLTFVPDQLLR